MLPVRFTGKAFASSSLSGREPSQAFESMPWTNSPSDKFPHTVWYKFRRRVKVVKFSFSSRSWGGLEQSPTRFALVGSNNCRRWRTIGRYKTKFTKSKQRKTWKVPTRRRRRFRCFGVKVMRVQKGKLTAISNLKMWRQGKFTQ